MAEVTLDIATKVISADHRIWAMFPGTGRKFFGTFAKEGVIFLDTPAIDLNERALTDDTWLRRHVAMSEAWAKYHYYAEETKPPSRRPDDYPAKKNASFNTLVGSVRHVFKDMMANSLR